MGTENGNLLSGTTDSYCSSTFVSESSSPALVGTELVQFFYSSTKSAEHGQAQNRDVCYLKDVTENYYYALWISAQRNIVLDGNLILLVDVDIKDRDIYLTTNEFSDQQVLLTFSENIMLIGEATAIDNWSFNSSIGTYVRCLNVEVIEDKKIRLTTTKFTPGASYTLSIPSGVIDRAHNLHFDNISTPFVIFNGVGASPRIAYTVSEDSTHIVVIFTETVNQTDASKAINYSTNPSLTISSSVKVSDMIYKLTTSQQTPGQTYVVTAVNIRDLDGNYIT